MAGLAPGLSRKLKKVLESRTDTPDVLGSLNTLSSFYTDNSPQNRRNLRSTIEKRSLSINIDFLRASDTAQQVLPLISAFFSAPIQLTIALSVLFLSLPIRRWIASRRRSMLLLIAAIGRTWIARILLLYCLAFSFSLLVFLVAVSVNSLSVGEIYS